MVILNSDHNFLHKPNSTFSTFLKFLFLRFSPSLFENHHMFLCVDVALHGFRQNY